MKKIHIGICIILLVVVFGALGTGWKEVPLTGKVLTSTRVTNGPELVAAMSTARPGTTIVMDSQQPFQFRDTITPAARHMTLTALQEKRQKLYFPNLPIPALIILPLHFSTHEK